MPHQAMPSLMKKTPAAAGRQIEETSLEDEMFVANCGELFLQVDASGLPLNRSHVVSAEPNGTIHEKVVQQASTVNSLVQMTENLQLND
ncbi:hypothetical protein CIB84_012750 [Bambusicola thoracicus]|uniref:Uncharacterized protein n=1 Tax=Bambusicola thoracicus TaxID=9083 RepID=A0A2P4SHB7_BAMTH|nr:hypothetical protein CIB84_012750 [Bambusicola thoracicus]